jgi:hypothetical protein
MIFHFCYNSGAGALDGSGRNMAKRLKDVKDIKIERPLRAKLSPEEVTKRMAEFPKRREKFVAAIRKGKN